MKKGCVVSRRNPRRGFLVLVPHFAHLVVGALVVCVEHLAVELWKAAGNVLEENRMSNVVMISELCFEGVKGRGGGGGGSHG